MTTSQNVLQYYRVHLPTGKRHTLYFDPFVTLQSAYVLVNEWNRVATIGTSSVIWHYYL